jgi:hypothetical protein
MIVKGTPTHHKAICVRSVDRESGWPVHRMRSPVSSIDASRTCLFGATTACGHAASAALRVLDMNRAFRDGAYRCWSAAAVERFNVEAATAVCSLSLKGRRSQLHSGNESKHDSAL